MTELPTSTDHDANIFNDPARIRRSSPSSTPAWRSRAAGAGRQRRHQGHRRRLLAVPAPLLGGGGAADRRGGDRLGRPGLPELNTQLWAASNPFVIAMYYARLLPGRAGQRVPAPDHRREAETRGTPAPDARGPDPGVPRRGALPPRAEYWHGIDLFGNIPLVDRGRHAGTHAAGAEHAPGGLRLRGERAERDRRPTCRPRPARAPTAAPPRTRRRCCWRNCT